MAASQFNGLRFLPCRNREHLTMNLKAGRCRHHFRRRCVMRPTRIVTLVKRPRTKSTDADHRL